jgi:DNA-binding SARP family transcriptional activator
MTFFLQLFGGFRLLGQEGKLVALPERSRALLSYLAMASSPVPRQILAELLSAEGSEQDQRTALRQAAYLARKAMADCAVICAQDSDLCLNDALVSADVRLFQSAVARGDDPSLAEALEHYRGPFLAGERSPSPVFEEWLGRCRRDLLEQALEALLKLAASDEAAGLHGSALARARRAVALDPLCEQAHRQVMRSLAATGQRSAALRQYEVMRQTLAEELGVAPDGDTEALRDAIARGVEPAPSGASAASPRARRDGAEEPEVAKRAGGAMRFRTAVRNGSRPVTRWTLALAILSLFVVGTASLWLARAPPVPSPPAAVVSDAAATPRAPRLSIVVLPFANFSGDPEQEYFADGSQTT